MEAVWKEDPIYVAIEEQKARLKRPFQSLPERKRILGQRPDAPDGMGSISTDDGEAG